MTFLSHDKSIQIIKLTELKADRQEALMSGNNVLQSNPGSVFCSEMCMQGSLC